ncbi:MAG: YchJ family metal-binding protein [Pseudomonadota bacterium]
MARKRSKAQDNGCPCGSGKLADDCCLPVIAGTRPAANPEALMRSRYTAYTLAETDYLLASWDTSTRPARLELDEAQRWLGLKILGTEGGGTEDFEGTVEFVARYKLAGRGYRLHEISRFRRTPTGWRYLEGKRGATDSSTAAGSP